MTDNKNIFSNIWKLYVIKASKWLMLFMPTIFLFFKENGLDLHDIMVIQAIYSVTIALIEIPSGYAADVLGRKNSMVIGTFFGFAGMLIYTFASGFWGFLPAALCLGIGQSFISGSDTALMYDSLVAVDLKEKFIKFEGRSIALGNFAEATAFILGGFLAEISLRTPFYYQSIIAFIGFAVAFMLIEPPVSKMSYKKPWANIRYIIKHSLKENIPLKWNIIYSSVIGATTLVMAWFAQPYYAALNMEVKYYGIVGAILNLAVAFTSFYAHRIEEKINTNKLLTFILIGLCFCYAFLGSFLNYWGLAILFLFYLIRGIATPVLRDYINRFTPSEMRATVMSIRSFMIRVIFAIFSPFLGYIADVYSIQTAFDIAAIVFFVIGLVSLIFYLKNEKTRLE